MRTSTLAPARRTVVLSLVLSAGVGACVSSSARPPNPFDGEAAERAEELSWSPDEIDRAEIERRAGTDHTAMALIRRLRPAWLRARGQNSFTDPGARFPVVYIDEIRHGGLSTLHQIPSAEIFRMEYYNTADATTRWGTGHPSGAINIVTGR